MSQSLQVRHHRGDGPANVPLDIKRYALLPLLTRDAGRVRRKCSKIDPEAQVDLSGRGAALQPSTRSHGSPLRRNLLAGAGPPPRRTGYARFGGSVFGMSASGERSGLGRAEPRRLRSHVGEINFDGYALVASPSLPPAGNGAGRPAAWCRCGCEPQRPGPNDPTKLQGRVARSGCVRSSANAWGRAGLGRGDPNQLLAERHLDPHVRTRLRGLDHAAAAAHKSR